MIHYASLFIVRRSFVLVLVATLLWGAAFARAADTASVSATDQLQFQQKNAQAQMAELQDRMFKLAQLTQEAEPDDAARLLMAVSRAREQLIIEQMLQSLNLLASKDFSHAADEQTQIILKLEELKKLLTTGGADLQMLLAKLRAINDAITKLDNATKEEKRLQDAANKLTDQQKAAPLDAKTLTGAQKDQQQNRKTTENIAQAVKTLGGQASAASATLGSASQSMAVAEGSLGSGKPSDASSQQIQAIASMQQARKQLQDERDKILMELEKMARKQVVMNLTEMLDRQKAVRAGTENAVEHLTASQREMLVKIKQLGTAETSIVRIADETIALIEETHFSVALPPALKRVQQKMAIIAATLNDSKADSALIGSEIKVEQDLQALLETFNELSKAKVTPGSCKGCKGDKNKLEAELKVVRMMQLGVNEDTVAVDAQRGAPNVAAQVLASLPADIDPMLKNKILTVRDGQNDVRDAMDRIHQQMTAPDEPADAEAPAQGKPQ